MSRFVSFIGMAAVILTSLVASPGTAATTAGAAINDRSPLFRKVWRSCGGPDYLAFEGEDDWLPNKMTREKLVVLTWRDRLQVRTMLLDRSEAPQGISCERYSVTLNIEGPGNTTQLVPVQVGDDLRRLPAKTTTFPFSGCPGKSGLSDAGGQKYVSESTSVLGKTSRGAPVSLVVKETGYLEVGSGYTTTELITLSTGGTKPKKLVVENWENFEAAD